MGDHATWLDVVENIVLFGFMGFVLWIVLVKMK